MDHIKNILAVIQHDGEDANTHWDWKSVSSASKFINADKINKGIIDSPAALQQNTAVIWPIA